MYSFTGATINGKSINIHVLDNHAANVSPTLAPSLTDKIKNRILSQTGLSPRNTDNVDYDISGTITGYSVSVSGVQNTQTATLNRLTVNVEIKFVNKLDAKSSFTQTFSRFADFSATQQLQAVEASLIDEIGTNLADDIFNKAFVNW